MDKNKDSQIKLEEFKTSIAKANAEFKKAHETLGSLIKKIKSKSKADCGESEPGDSSMEDLMDVIYSLVGNCHDRIDSVANRYWSMSDDMYAHANKGHLPPLNADAMGKLLKSCGMDGCYDIQKPVITSCAHANKRPTLEVDLK